MLELAKVKGDVSFPFAIEIGRAFVPLPARLLALESFFLVSTVEVELGFSIVCLVGGGLVFQKKRR